MRADGREVAERLLHEMCARIEHRGPDSRGIHCDGAAGLGIQRLRVIDLATGDQPIYNEDRSVAVVLNGEIYNYRQLRRELELEGHRFYTNGDTEVLVHLYERDGTGFVSRLHGMFAFALWDERARRLVLARDRVGKKPLFYARRRGALSFASSLGALMADPEIPREVDYGALDAYLAYLYVPAPMTAFRSVSKLPPATVLVYEDGGVQTRRYWRLDYSAKRAVPDRRVLEEELREQIRAAVRRRLIADVPVGAFLSGGVDSAAVVAAMAESSSGPVKTFSIGFDHERYNELPRARQVAARYGTDHHELTVEPDAVEIVPAIVRHYGEPFADSSAIPSFYLARFAREHVTVALNGDGGDESFAGYNRYLSNLLARRVDALPFWARRLMSRSAASLPASSDVAGAASRVRRFAETLCMDAASRYARYQSHITAEQRHTLYTDQLRELVGVSPAAEAITGPWHEATGHTLVDRMLEVDVRTYLPGDLLVKMDVASMAYSLEARSPLLDHELMEFAASLPPGLKVRGATKKALLRDAVRPWVPEEILSGPKRGFSIPLAHWFRHELKDYATDVLLDPSTLDRGYFSEPYVRQLLSRHFEAAEDNAAGIWTLLMFELWHRDFIDGAVASPASVETRVPERQ